VRLIVARSDDGSLVITCFSGYGNEGTLQGTKSFATIAIVGRESAASVPTYVLLATIYNLLRSRRFSIG